MKLLHGILASAFLSTISTSYGTSINEKAFNTFEEVKNDSNFKAFFEKTVDGTKPKFFTKQGATKASDNSELARLVLSKLKNVYLQNTKNDQPTSFEKNTKLHPLLGTLYNELYKTKFNSKKFTTAYKKLADFVHFDPAISDAQSEEDDIIKYENDRLEKKLKQKRRTIKTLHEEIKVLNEEKKELDKIKSRCERLINDKGNEIIKFQAKDLKDLLGIVPQMAKYNLITLVFQDDNNDKRYKTIQQLNRDIQKIMEFLVSDRSDFEKVRPIIEKLIEQGVLTGQMSDYQR